MSGIKKDESLWSTTLKRVDKALVIVQSNQRRSFDGYFAGAVQGTGFIIAIEAGSVFVLTAKHVVHGPSEGICVFHDHQKFVYKVKDTDPIHDWAILDIHVPLHLTANYKVLPLKPDAATVGLDCKIMGNNAGEERAILSATISQVDRDAPYHSNSYHDFNVAYIQADAGGTGGSSGSPLIDVNGNVVAMVTENDGEDIAMTNFFITLDILVRALEDVRNGRRIPRGTIQTKWLSKLLAECRSLGLSAEMEMELLSQAPDTKKLLFADKILPLGPAHDRIQHGDLLLCAGGQTVTSQLGMESILDSNEGKELTLGLLRKGTFVEVTVSVQDLYAVTPSRFLDFSGATFHDISLQKAMEHNIPCRGVYVADADEPFKLTTKGFFRNWLIEKVGDIEISNLDEFIAAVKCLPHNSKTTIYCYNLWSRHEKCTVTVTLHRRTLPMDLWCWNTSTKTWDCTKFAPCGPSISPPLSGMCGNDKIYPKVAATALASSVHVYSFAPAKLDSLDNKVNEGYGVVVEDKGVVLVSKAVVPSDSCEVLLTFSERNTLPAEGIFCHPLNGFALVKYDPDKLPKTVAAVKQGSQIPIIGSSVIFLTFCEDRRPIVTNTTVTDYAFVKIPADDLRPRYRTINTEVLQIESPLGSQHSSGILLDNDGTLVALWQSCPSYKRRNCYGLPVAPLEAYVHAFVQGDHLKWRFIDTEFSALRMEGCRDRGVTPSWIDEVFQVRPTRNQLLVVKNGRLPFENGDIVLSIDGKPATDTSKILVLEKEQVDAMVVRNRKEISLTIHTQPLSILSTSHAVRFCGLLLQKPHFAVSQRRLENPSEIYVADIEQGSPGAEVKNHSFITHLNGNQCRTLDQFLTVAEGIQRDTSFTLTQITPDDQTQNVEIWRQDRFFPLTEYVKTPEKGAWEVSETRFTEGL
ncbi:uncharacterized protein PV07_04725 [Cladophialophora immunda]|uniref:Pro-apoptotic serine protease NMA111 n=1 Tax=Cladophialophora immunda TaxID=569365 RepID=A0A0D2AUF0_9EURO|nr:uncharacterized protein PV07_04725 [Cladophialophora immunda]KIW28862.1 hypothetical protein PV07_04725 [Cladophialophora immunda]